MFSEASGKVVFGALKAGLVFLPYGVDQVFPYYFLYVSMVVGHGFAFVREIFESAKGGDEAQGIGRGVWCGKGVPCAFV